MIQIIHRRKKYTKQIAKIYPEFWDARGECLKESHVMHAKVNKLISEETQKVKDYILDCGIKQIEPNPAYFFNRASAGVTLSELLTRKEQQLITHQKFRSAGKYKTVAKRLQESKLDGPISAITSRAIADYQAYCANLGKSTNTISKDLECFRSVVNEAIAEGLIDKSPFRNIKIKRPRSQKRKLTMEEFNLWCSAEITKPQWIVSRDIFACSTMLRGMRAHDILTLQKSQIVNGRLQYKANKTGKLYDMKIPEAAMTIIEKYISTPGIYLFPLVKLSPTVYLSDKKYFEDHVNAKNSYVNKYTKELATHLGISKKVTMHIARHTFGYLLDRRGVQVTTIRDLYGHSSLSMTEIYIQELRESDELDKAVEGLF